MRPKTDRQQGKDRSEVRSGIAASSVDMIVSSDAPNVLPVFDYATLAPALAERTRKRAERIQGHARRTVMIFGEIGQELLAARSELAHGQFLAWVATKVHISQATAYRAMDIAKNLGDKLLTLKNLPLATVQAIAASSTPATLRDRIVNDIETGTMLTSAEILDKIKSVRDERRKSRRTVSNPEPRSVHFPEQDEDQNEDMSRSQPQPSFAARPDPAHQIPRKNHQPKFDSRVSEIATIIVKSLLESEIADLALILHELSAPGTQSPLAN